MSIPKLCTIVLIMLAGCSYNPVIVRQYRVIDHERTLEECFSDGNCKPNYVYTKCKEEVWEYGKGSYIRDCD